MGKEDFRGRWADQPGRSDAPFPHGRRFQGDADQDDGADWFQQERELLHAGDRAARTHATEPALLRGR